MAIHDRSFTYLHFLAIPIKANPTLTHPKVNVPDPDAAQRQTSAE